MSIHEKVKFPCDQCDKRFSHQGSLQRHIQSAHEQQNNDKKQGEYFEDHVKDENVKLENQDG